MESQAPGGGVDLTATGTASTATVAKTATVTSTASTVTATDSGTGTGTGTTFGADVATIERELMLISRYTVLATNRSAAEQYLDRSAYLLLSRIEAEGPMSIGQLAEAFGLDTSTINRQTAAMSRGGLVERIPDPEGGLARKLRITDGGLHRLRANRARAVDGIGRLLTDWDPNDLSTLAHLLAQFNTAIERRQGRPWPRPDQTVPSSH